MFNIYHMSPIYYCCTEYIQVCSYLITDMHLTSDPFACRKNIFNHIQHFIHLNLCIALLLGLITFVTGIETASEYRVRKL